VTAEEFSAEADKVISPAIERLVQMAFETVPRENVEMLVRYYRDMVKEYATGAVRSIISDRRN
jgi:predicted phosphohydrolase